MCGRFTLEGPGDQLKDFFEIDDAPILQGDRFNIAPTQDVLVVQRDPKRGRAWTTKSWGLIPSWSRDRTKAARMINARVETVSEKPSFRDPFQRRRCVIPATGYYEWVRHGAKKAPYYIHPTSQQPLAFAGLWDRWTAPNGVVVESCTIITRSATAGIEEVHHRMPVLLERSFIDRWLNPEHQIDPKDLLHAPPIPLQIVRVSDRVNSVRNDDRECISSQAEPPQGDAVEGQLKLLI